MRYLFLFLFVHCCLFLSAFTPRSIQVKGESYFIFPYPIEHSSLAIPPYPEKLPDGNYLGYSKTVRYYGFSIWKMKKVVKTIDSTLSVSFVLNNQLPDGEATFFQTNKKVYANGQFNNGLQDGEWKIYSENKLEKILQYRNGKKHGAQKTFFENGKLKRQEHFEDNERSGKFFEYLPNGKLKEEGEFVKGNLVLSKKYYTNGNLSSTKIYKDTIIENDSILRLMEIPRFNPFGAQERFYQTYQYTKFKENGLEYYTIYRVNNKIINVRFGCDEKGRPYGKLTKLDPDSLQRNARFELELTDPKGYVYIQRKRLSNPNYSFELSLSPNGDTISFSSTTEKIPLADGYLFNQEIKQNKSIKNTQNIYRHVATNWYHNNLSTNKIFFENGVWKLNKKQEMLQGRLQRSLWFSKIPDVFTSTTSIRSYYSDPDVHGIDSHTKTDSSYYTLDGKPLNGEVHFVKGKKNRVKQDKAITTIETTDYVWNVYALTEAKGRFENGIKTGQWVYQYLNGDEIHCSYHHGKLNGSYLKLYAKSGWTEEELDLARSCGIENKKLKYPRLHVALKNGFTHGDAVVLDFTGTILINATFHNGNLHGKLETVNILGKNLLKANYRNGKLDGAFHAELIRYNPENIYESKNHEVNTQGAVNCIFEQDTLNGTFRYLKNNQPIIEGEVKKNLAVGQWKVAHFYDKFSGLLHFTTTLNEEDSLDVKNAVFETHLNDTEIPLPLEISTLSRRLKRNGEVKVFSTDGKLTCELKANKTQYLSGKIYYPTGELSQSIAFFPRTTRMFTADSTRIVGNITSYLKNGKVWSVAVFGTYSFEFDCETGVELLIPRVLQYTELYDQNGKAMLVNGNGYCMFYDYKGILHEEGEMLNHQRNGQWKIYDNTGKLSAIGHYVNGKKNGFWITGDLTGINSLSNYCLDETNPELKAFLEKELANLNFTVEYFEMGESVQYQSTHVDTYEYIWPSKKMYKKRSLYSDEF